MSSVIVDWRRTPFSRSHKGELSEVRPDEFASQVLIELLNHQNIDTAEIDDVIKDAIISTKISIYFLVHP